MTSDADYRRACKEVQKLGLDPDSIPHRRPAEMDRLFLDANVLFSAAYRSDAGLLRLWQLKDAVLCTSHYASEEARINLIIDDVQRQRLAKLLERIEFCDAPGRELPAAISLPEKDVPIVRAAIEARATHLLTGDVRHFGPYFGKNVGGVLIS